MPATTWSMNLPAILSFMVGSFSEEVLTLRNLTSGLMVMPCTNTVQ